MYNRRCIPFPPSVVRIEDAKGTFKGVESPLACGVMCIEDGPIFLIRTTFHMPLRFASSLAPKVHVLVPSFAMHLRCKARRIASLFEDE